MPGMKVLQEGTCKSKPYIKYPMRQEDFLNFQIDMNDMYNFLIDKLAKDIGREIINTGIDCNNEKIKKSRWIGIREVHPHKEATCTILCKYNLQVPCQAVNIGH